jgi:hypothetical protein
MSDLERDDDREAGCCCRGVGEEPAAQQHRAALALPAAAERAVHVAARNDHLLNPAHPPAPGCPTSP